MKYIIATFGCKVNQYETQGMEAMLRERGHSAAETAEEADAVIVNSCAVTAESTRKARQAIRRLRGRNPRAVLAVCGCFSQVNPEQVLELGADLIYGSGDRRGFIGALERAVEPGGTGLFREPVIRVGDPFRRRAFELLPAGAFAGHTRAYLKIQDGCDNFCAYCVIPYARGRVRSLPVAECADQAANLASQGYRELVLTGIEIASYGKDLGEGVALPDAVEAVASAAQDVRLRLGSLEPRAVTEEFCRRLRGAGRLCRHFHLSLQSGCDGTLRRMGRKYDTARFMRSVELLREHFPGCGLTADLIVGFPGETEEEFAETLAFLERCAFSGMHVFPYSVRPGTRAAAMDGQVPKGEKTRRAAEAQRVADSMAKAYLGSCVGRRLEVLFEAEQDGVCTGHGDNYAEVSVPGERLRGLVRNVEITGVRGKMLVGVFV